jgi:hypothetical protein
MLIYRLISWLFIAAIGWVLFFFLFRTESQIDPDAEERGGIDAEPNPDDANADGSKHDGRPDDP